MADFPSGFLLGCATAAHQVEGDIDNDWARMEREQPQRIRDGSISGRAIDHWHRWREDLGELAARGQNAHRFSIEWARIEPRPGEVDASALAHYAEVIATCRRLGMEPLVTLQHFTLPRWVADAGGLCTAQTPVWFARYAALCAEAFGDQVRWWMTLNEPEVLAVFGHLYGEWPPLRRSLPSFFAALRGAARMHAAGYHAIHQVARSHGRPAMVSVAHHERPLRAASTSPLDRLAAVMPHRVFNRWFLNSCRSGLLMPPVGTGQFVTWLRGSLDWIGLNYYADEEVSFDLSLPGNLFARNAPTSGLPRSDFNWAIDGRGLHRALVDMQRRFGLPIIVTENGVADVDDELRPRFLLDYLRAVRDALDDGVDVRGYLHWTAWDNFEWAEGYSKRFGLFSVDRITMERRAKPSAALYERICRTRTIPEDAEAEAIIREATVSAV